MAKFGLNNSLKAQPGKGAELRAILIKAAELMSKVEGCYLYAVGQYQDSDEVTVMEIWESAEHHASSLQTEGVQPLIASAMPLIAEMPKMGRKIDIEGGHAMELN